MTSNWPIDGKVSKAARHNYVHPERKYIDSYFNNKGYTLEETKNHHNDNQGEISHKNKGRDESPSGKKRDRSLSNEIKKQNFSEKESDTKTNVDKKTKNKNSNFSNSKTNTYECCSKSCGKFVKIPLWYIILNKLIKIVIFYFLYLFS